MIENARRKKAEEAMLANYLENGGMKAKDNYPKGTYFILHDVCYQALQSIPKGTEVKPGINAAERNLNELMNGGN